MALDDSQRREITAVVTDSKFPHLASHLEPLPPLSLDGVAATFAPTLIVSVGRSANLVVEQLRARLGRQYGSPSELPALGWLALDTDRKTCGPSSGPATPTYEGGEFVPVPLKPAEQYRAKARQKFAWLSRRWIYNIPRSGQTEGLRPLGRLAFVDHCEMIYQRIKNKLAELLRPEHLALTAVRLGLEPQSDPVRVYLVAASAGGSGSGMLLDLAYAVRTLLSELEGREASITGMLIHTTPRGVNEQLLAIANTLGLLTEVWHTNQFGYPGDPSCGLPEFPDQPVFDHTYLMHLGDGISAPAYRDGLDALADYLYLDLATPCQKFFARCRMEDDGFEIRSASTRRCGIGIPREFDEQARALARSLRDRWLKPEGWKPPPEGIGVDELLAAHGLTSAAAAADARQAAATEWQEAWQAVESDSSPRLPDEAVAARSGAPR